MWHVVGKNYACHLQVSGTALLCTHPQVSPIEQIWIYLWVNMHRLVLVYYHICVSTSTAHSLGSQVPTQCHGWTQLPQDLKEYLAFTGILTLPRETQNSPSKPSLLMEQFSKTKHHSKHWAVPTGTMQCFLFPSSMSFEKCPCVFLSNDCNKTGYVSTVNCLGYILACFLPVF